MKVGMLAPMQPELEPIVRRLGLEADGDVHRGHAGDVEVVAMLTTIGYAGGEAAARRILEHGVDWVMVVGVAGGVDRTLEIGGVVIPEEIVDRATGTSYRPTPIAGVAARGIISCGDQLMSDPATIEGLAAKGVVAVEMESAAIAPVCDEAGIPWAAFRGISDFAADGLVNDDIFAMTNPDGTAVPDAITRYLAEHPEQLEVLTQLGRDTALATDNAAAAAIAACAAL